MRYEKVKRELDRIIDKSPALRKILYLALNFLFLRAWYVRKEIKKFLAGRSDSVNVLDAGCGFGQYAYFIARNFKNAKVLGVDINAERIKSCKKFSRDGKIENLDFEVADLEKIDIDKKFDLILAVDILEHIPDDVGVLKNFHRAMKPNSILIISTPSNIGGSEVHSDEDESFIEEHVRNGYGIDEIVRKLQDAGFKDVKAKYTYGKFGSLSWKLAIKIPLLLLGKSFVFIIVLPFYYLLTLPLIFILMWLDTKIKNPAGTGLLVTARK